MILFAFVVSTVYCIGGNVTFLVCLLLIVLYMYRVIVTHIRDRVGVLRYVVRAIFLMCIIYVFTFSLLHPVAV